MFKMIDTDNSGNITFEELKAGLNRCGANLNESEIYDLMKAVRTLFQSCYTCCHHLHLIIVDKNLTGVHRRTLTIVAPSTMGSS